MFLSKSELTASIAKAVVLVNKMVLVNKTCNKLILLSLLFKNLALICIFYPKNLGKSRLLLIIDLLVKISNRNFKTYYFLTEVLSRCTLAKHFNN